jgi:molybdate transport system regulatory protein
MASGKYSKNGFHNQCCQRNENGLRQAWQLVQEMNQHAESPLVEKSLGGKGAGGARLTKAGEKAIVNFYEIEKSIKDFAQQEFQNLKFYLL